MGTYCAFTHVNIVTADNPRCRPFAPLHSGGSIKEESEPSVIVRDTAVEVTLLVVDSDGNVVEEKKALGMEF